MAGGLSKTQIDRLGDRLKRGNITEADLRLLDQYRRSFTEAYEIVVGRIRNELGLEPTGRPAKSTTSISDKLRRESIRLTQIQDIAGCRLIVVNTIEQDILVITLNKLFEKTTVADRRQQPSHGYRAVHVIVNSNGKLIEIQIRTTLQQVWAELSEKFSDVIDPSIKYGGGKGVFKKMLAYTSSASARFEGYEARVMALAIKYASQGNAAEASQQIVNLEKLASIKHSMLNSLHGITEGIESVVKGDYDKFEKDVNELLKDESNDFSN